MHKQIIFVEFLLQYCFLVMLAVILYQKFFRFSKNIAYFELMAGFFAAGASLYYIINHSMYYSLVVCSILYLLFVFFLLYTVFKTNCFQLTFSCFVIINFEDMISLIRSIADASFFTVQQRYFSLKENLLIMAGLYLMFFAPAYIFFAKYLCQTLMETNHFSFWKYLWLIPFFFYLTSHFSINPYFNTCNLSIISDSKNLALPFFWNIGTYLTYYVIIKMLAINNKNKKLAEKIKISSIQLIMQQKQYNKLQYNIEEARRMRHDLRQHFLVLTGYEQDHDYQEMEKYLKSIIKNLPKEEHNFCRNKVINSILCYYYTMASKTHIRIDMESNLPEHLPVADNDAGMILGNLIDNAIESCTVYNLPEPFIQVKLNTADADTILIQVRHGWHNTILMKNNSSINSNYKFNLNLDSIKNLADFYHGNISFQTTSNSFTTYIILKKQPDKI